MGGSALGCISLLTDPMSWQGFAISDILTLVRNDLCFDSFRVLCASDN